MACRIENLKTLWLLPNRYSSTSLDFWRRTAVDHQLELVNIYFSNGIFSSVTFSIHPIEESPTFPSHMITSSSRWQILAAINGACSLISDTINITTSRSLPAGESQQSSPTVRWVSLCSRSFSFSAFFHCFAMQPTIQSHKANL
jgi:hypothetical protein